VVGAEARDWEDIAIAPDGDGWSILIGDTGDNGVRRGDVTLWRIPEPDPASPGDTAPAEPLVLAYPDGPHDAETLLADPRTGDVYVLSKSMAGSHVYRAAAPLVDGSTMEDVATVPFGGDTLPGDPLATGGDLSADGGLILVRTYTRAFVWRRAADGSVAEAFAGEPCPVPVASEFQGEAAAFEADGRAYRTVAEGAHPTLWKFDRVTPGGGR
jgi:hypothetical protein